MYNRTPLTDNALTASPSSRFGWGTPLQLILVFAITCFTAPRQMRAADGGVGDGTSTAEGNNALSMLSSGTDDTGLGFNALTKNDTGSENTGVGSTALASNTSGQQNTALGFGALSSNKIGVANTAIGALALFTNTGNDNAATGFQALVSNTTGHENTADGPAALGSNTTGFDNTATGEGALELNTVGNNNTADGMTALLNNTTGNNNIALGYRAGINLTTGNNNIEIGNQGKATDANIIRIGVQGTQNSTFIAGISGTSVSGAQVVVTSNGKLGVATSSARFKEAIKPMDKTSETVLKLKPVTFRYKEEIDPEKAPQFGLIAEDVEKVDPELVVHDEQGKPYTVRYDAVNAMLLNEFLKAHKCVQELRASNAEEKQEIAELSSTIAQAKADIKALTATQKAQAAQIHQVNRQLTLNGAEPPLADTGR